jgi:hypothetical protein
MIPKWLVRVCVRTKADRGMNYFSANFISSSAYLEVSNNRNQTTDSTHAA